MTAETALERAVDRHNGIKGEHGEPNKAQVLTDDDPLTVALCGGTKLEPAELLRFTNQAAQQMVTGLVLGGLVTSSDGGATVTMPARVLTQVVRGVFFDGLCLGARVEADAA